MPTFNLTVAACNTVDATLLADYDSGVKPVPVSQCSTSSYVVKRDNCIVLGMLLHVRHWALAGNKAPVDRSSGRVAAFGNNNTKKQQNMTYDRIMTFADLRSSTGACFAVLTQTCNESDHLLKYCKDDIAVGKVFAILEPEPIRRYLSSSLPIIACTDPFIPLKAIVQYLHDVPPRIAKPGETLYFSQQGQEIAVSTACIEERTCSCKGELCDRQEKIESHQKGACGCLTVGRKPGFVIDITVFLNFPTDFQAEYINDEDIIGSEINQGMTRRVFVRNFRSWHLTKALLKNVSDFSVEKHSRDILRQKIANIVDFINHRGGWTVVGWHRRGVVADASNGESTVTTNPVDQIGSTTQQIHVSYIYPSNPALVADRGFNRRRYRCSSTFESDDDSNNEPEMEDHDTSESGIGADAIQRSDINFDDINNNTSDTDDEDVGSKEGKMRRGVLHESGDEDEYSTIELNANDLVGNQHESEAAEISQPEPAPKKARNEKQTDN